MVCVGLLVQANGHGLELHNRLGTHKHEHESMRARAPANPVKVLEGLLAS